MEPPEKAIEPPLGAELLTKLQSVILALLQRRLLIDPAEDPAELLRKEQLVITDVAILQLISPHRHH